MNVKTPEHGQEVLQKNSGPDLDAVLAQNGQMQGRLKQSTIPQAGELRASHPELFNEQEAEKVNGGAVAKSRVHKGRNGNSVLEKRGATAKALAQDKLEAAQLDAQDMAEAEDIMDQVDAAKESSQESADNGGIPEGNPERAEVGALNTSNDQAEASAGKNLSSIEADTATAMNQALSGVKEDGPNNLTQAG